MMLKNLFVVVLLFAAELLYFRVADRCNIIDKPNERSSHKGIILRGGGIIFLIGAQVNCLLFLVNRKNSCHLFPLLYHRIW